MVAKTVKQSGGGKTRQSGIELLRIFAMLIIILHHVILFCSIDRLADPLDGAHAAVMAALCSFGKTGVAIFFLITGYFLCARTTPPKPRRVFPIIRQAGFYWLASLVLCLCFFPNLLPFSFPPGGMWPSFLEIFTAGSYWFIGAYVLLMILSPQIKKMLDSLSDKELTRMCLVIAIVVAAATEVMRLTRLGGGITVFVFPSAFTYTLIGYTVRRREKEIKSCGWAVVAILVGAFLIAITPLISTFYYNHGFGDVSSLFCRDQATGTMLVSIGLLIVFSRMKWQNRFVNYVASLTLGIYLIHNNPFITGVLIHATGVAWKVYDLMYEQKLWLGVPGVIALAVGVFVVCGAIEALRRLIVRIIAKVCVI